MRGAAHPRHSRLSTNPMAFLPTTSILSPSRNIWKRPVRMGAKSYEPGLSTNKIVLPRSTHGICTHSCSEQGSSRDDVASHDLARQSERETTDAACGGIADGRPAHSQHQPSRNNVSSGQAAPISPCADFAVVSRTERQKRFQGDPEDVHELWGVRRADRFRMSFCRSVI